MNDSEIIFTSYCFGDRYLEQQVRLEKSILDIYPNANLHFVNEREETGKPKFQKSLYGFKVRMVKDCLEKGFKKIIFFDTAVCLNDKVDYWFYLVQDYGILAPIDRQKLNTVTSDNCLKYMGVERRATTEWNLVGGSVYVFDFENEKCQKIFAMWERMETDGMFGTQDDLSNDRLQSHRMDETCMACALILHGVNPAGHDIMRYAWEHPESKVLHSNGVVTPIVIKRHFK